jgi:redox-sensitive bicupin YhaK (pirin superfamily)
VRLAGWLAAGIRHEDIPVVESADGKATVTVWAGTAVADAKPLDPPPDSWAADPASCVGVWHLVLKPGAVYTVAAASCPEPQGGKSKKHPVINRSAYFIEGPASALLVAGSAGDAAKPQPVPARSVLTLDAGAPVTFTNQHESAAVELLVLQGRAIAEPVAKHGPFVMNTQAEIQQVRACVRACVHVCTARLFVNFSSLPSLSRTLS